MVTRNDDLSGLSKDLPEVIGSYRNFSDDSNLDAIGRRWPIFLDQETAELRSIPRLSDAQIEIFSQSTPISSLQNPAAGRKGGEGDRQGKAIQELLNRLKMHEISPRVGQSGHVSDVGLPNASQSPSVPISDVPINTDVVEEGARSKEDLAVANRLEKAEAQPKKTSPLGELFARLDRENSSGFFRRQGSFFNKSGKK